MAASSAARVVAPTPTPQGLADVFDLVSDDFARLNRLIPRQLSSGIALVEEIGRHIVNAGGKRLRPLIVLLSARAAGHAGHSSHAGHASHAGQKGAADQNPVRLATVIEFLHTATLLHDDVVDKSDRRRGQATANVLWGNAPSVLVGDFLYSRGFQLMVEIDSMDVMAIISDATNLIAEGEVMQLANIGKLDMAESEYREVARRKTAMLFQAAAHTGGVLGTDDADAIDSLRRYGQRFGMAYQLVDDWLDYAGDSHSMGKNPGDDLAEGKVTLPLIHTMVHGNGADAGIVREAIDRRSAEDFDAVAGAVRRSGGLDYTKACAETEAEAAMEELLLLPPSLYRDALESLAMLSVSRMA